MITTQEQIWAAVVASMPRGRWVSLQEIYQLVSESVALTPEDHASEAEGASQERWQRNVRNVLQGRKATGDVLWDRAAEYMLAPRLCEGSPQDGVSAELAYRMSLWEKIAGGRSTARVAPDVLGDLRIHVGEQGIFRDKHRTAPLTEDEAGVTVGVLHTGRFYADDLSEDGLLYHYPRTDRPDTHDQGEIEATKSAGRLSLPVFAITRSPDRGARQVDLGWVEGWDDEMGVFLITFGETAPAELLAGVAEDEPFQLVEERESGLAAVRSRHGQHRFKFRVFQRYGPACAVCGMAVRELLDAVHIRPRSENGSDDPRNGLVLCASHHRAFDAGLFGIEAESVRIACRDAGPTSEELRLTSRDLRHLRKRPHPQALQWRWERRGSSGRVRPATRAQE
jgi:hypothetical protein